MMKIQDFPRKIMATSDPFCGVGGLGKVGIEWHVITYGGKSGKWDVHHLGAENLERVKFRQICSMQKRKPRFSFFHFSQVWMPVRVGKLILTCCHLHASLLPSGFSFGATCHLHNHSDEERREPKHWHFII